MEAHNSEETISSPAVFPRPRLLSDRHKRRPEVISKARFVNRGNCIWFKLPARASPQRARPGVSHPQ
jgi:hypothetical protein